MSTSDGLSGSVDWKNLYSAVLGERDKAKIPLLIQDAELAIVLRARHLYKYPGDNLQEQYALDAALTGLRALRSCLAPSRKGREVA
jgi:hypothetical protein